MSDAADLDLSRLIGTPEGRLPETLGEPEVSRRVAGNRWLVYERPGLSLRVRCGSRGRGAGGGAGRRVAAWTATFDFPGPATLREAAERLGLWPQLAPDVTASAVEEPMVRRPLEDPETGEVHSVTAAVRAGGIGQVTAFDEPPEWEGDGGGPGDGSGTSGGDGRPE